MGKPFDATTATVSQPIIVPPKPKFEFLIELATLIIGIFTLIKVTDISNRLTELENDVTYKGVRDARAGINGGAKLTGEEYGENL